MPKTHLDPAIMDLCGCVMDPSVLYTPKTCISTGPNMLFGYQRDVFGLHETQLNWAIGQAMENEMQEYYWHVGPFKLV
jgi:hypothetical protein